MVDNYVNTTVIDIVLLALDIYKLKQQIIK